jgi:hypothetical protein
MASKQKSKGSKKANAKKGGTGKLNLHKETVKDMKMLVKGTAKNRQSINVCVV